MYILNRISMHSKNIMTINSDLKIYIVIVMCSFWTSYQMEASNVLYIMFSFIPQLSFCMFRYLQHLTTGSLNCSHKNVPLFK